MKTKSQQTLYKMEKLISLIKSMIVVATTFWNNSLSELHANTMLARSGHIQLMLKITVKFKGQVIWALLCFQEYRYYSLANGQFMTKVACKEPSICKISDCSYYCERSRCSLHQTFFKNNVGICTIVLCYINYNRLIITSLWSLMAEQLYRLFVGLKYHFTK